MRKMLVLRDQFSRRIAVSFDNQCGRLISGKVILFSYLELLFSGRSQGVKT
jgi:hypothetical protein